MPDLEDSPILKGESPSWVCFDVGHLCCDGDNYLTQVFVTGFLDKRLGGRDESLELVKGLGAIFGADGLVGIVPVPLRIWTCRRPRRIDQFQRIFVLKA